MDTVNRDLYVLLRTSQYNYENTVMLVARRLWISN
jgi:hypothetical protein